MTVREDRVHQVWDLIVNNQQRWKQDMFGQQTECGTAYCMAGWAVIAAGGKTVTGSDWTDVDFFNADGAEVDPSWFAEEWLGLDGEQAEELFIDSWNITDLDKMKALIEEQTGVAL